MLFKNLTQVMPANTSYVDAVTSRPFVSCSMPKFLCLLACVLSSVSACMCSIFCGSLHGFCILWLLTWVLSSVAACVCSVFYGCLHEFCLLWLLACVLSSLAAYMGSVFCLLLPL